MVTMAEEREREHRERGLRFTEVRDPRGRLLFRVSTTGIVEVREKGKTILVNIWDYITVEELPP